MVKQGSPKQNITNGHDPLGFYIIFWGVTFDHGCSTSMCIPLSKNMVHNTLKSMCIIYIYICVCTLYNRMSVYTYIYVYVTKKNGYFIHLPCLACIPITTTTTAHTNWTPNHWDAIARAKSCIAKLQILSVWRSRGLWQTRKIPQEMETMLGNSTGFSVLSRLNYISNSKGFLLFFLQHPSRIQ